jgi:O-antigen ligase
MTYIFISLLLLLPFGHFFFKQMDIWHAQGQFVQIGILTLFCYAFFEKPKRINITNKPLGSFIFWAGLVTSYWWIYGFEKAQQYPIRLFMPFFNLLVMVLFYKLVVEYLDKEKIGKILKYLRYSFILVLFYCVLQYLNLDEFFKNKVNFGNDVLVGTIGQPSHLGSLLAIISPLFFEKKRESILALILLWMVVILTNSAIGLVCSAIVFLFWLFFNNKKVAIGLSILSLLSIGYLALFHNGFFSSSGRFKIWEYAFDIFKNHPITGQGLGSFGAQKIYLINYGVFQHLHNEYYQIAFEQSKK